MTAHPLMQRLAELTGATEVSPENIDAFEADAAEAMVFFAGDPVRFPEALDLAVVLPELHAAFGRRWRIGVVPAAVEDALARRYGVQRWPSLVFLRHGHYIGMLSGMRDWEVFLHDMQRLQVAPPSRPSLPIAVAADTRLGSHCH